MDHLIVDEVPKLNSPIMVVSFSGWPDAQEAATGAMRHLAKQLPTRKFASIDAEDFYVFTRTRHHVGNNDFGEREVKWPTNEFSYWHDDAGERDILLFTGVEPQLKWKTYASTIVNVAIQHKVEMVIVVGSLLDGIPHTRAPRITGSANVKDVDELMEQETLQSSNYQGPTGITSAVMEECAKNNIKYTSLWGHAPHYLQTTPNPRVSMALVKQIAMVLGLDISLKELEESFGPYDRRVLKSMATDLEAVNYIQGLEDKYDQALEMQEEAIQDELPDSDAVIEEVEAFFRQNSPGDDSDPFGLGDHGIRS